MKIIIVLLSMLINKLVSKEWSALAQRIIQVFSMLAHPSVLASGVYMIIQIGIGPDRPLWLDIMEKGGGMIILLTLILIGILGSRVKKRIVNGHDAKLTGYLTTAASSMILIGAIIFIVSVKI